MLQQCLSDDKNPVPPSSKKIVSPYASRPPEPTIVLENKGYHLPSDELLGIKSLEQMKREKHFMDCYAAIEMKHWELKKAAMVKI